MSFAFFASVNIIIKKLFSEVDMNRQRIFPNLYSVLRQRPQAYANIRGSENYSDIYGLMLFYQTRHGVIVAIEATGLPIYTESCKKPIFALHIHEGGACTGNVNDPFSDAKTHYNPNNCPHPYHAGDMPPLFGANGRAFSVFLTDRLTVREIVGRTAIIHLHPDDFHTQPAGNAGEKIACGVIKAVR